MSYILLFNNSYEGLKYLSDDTNVTNGTFSYLMYYLPGFLMYGLADLNRKYLNSFSQNFVPMIGFMISVLFHPIWGSYLSQYYGIKGIALSSLITNSLTFILLKIFMRFTNHVEHLSIFSWTTFDLKEYFLLGLPYFFIQFLDYWAWEQMTLVSGQISLADQTA